MWMSVLTVIESEVGSESIPVAVVSSGCAEYYFDDCEVVVSSCTSMLAVKSVIGWTVAVGSVEAAEVPGGVGHTEDIGTLISSCDV